MRRLLIAVTGIAVALAGATQAQGTFGTPRKDTFGRMTPSMPKQSTAPDYGVPAREPYKSHAAPKPPSYSAPETFKPYGGYEPYKPASIYGPPAASKPTKPKSLFDR
jgi:hypothetical protein